MPSRQNKNLNVPASSEGLCLIVKVPLSSIQHPLEDPGMFIFTYPTWWDYTIIQTTYHPSFNNKSHKDRSISKSVQKATKITRNNQLIHKKTRRVSTSYIIWRCFVHINWCFFVPDFFPATRFRKHLSCPASPWIPWEHFGAWKVSTWNTHLAGKLDDIEPWICAKDTVETVKKPWYIEWRKAVHGGNVAFFLLTKADWLVVA